MIKFTEAVNLWKTPMFADALQDEIKRLNIDQLHLQQALLHGSYASADYMSLIILSVNDEADYIHARVGVFYIGIISGCQCEDDPTSINEQNEYCELMFNINKKTAETQVVLLS